MLIAPLASSSRADNPAPLQATASTPSSASDVIIRRDGGLIARHSPIAADSLRPWLQQNNSSEITNTSANDMGELPVGLTLNEMERRRERRRRRQTTAA